jgi:hypothetical protein
MRIPENAVLQGPPQGVVQTGSEPKRTDNFRPATITVTDDGNIKPPSILPVVFGAGMALFIIYNARNAGFGNFTFNFR